MRVAPSRSSTSCWSTTPVTTVRSVGSPRLEALDEHAFAGHEVRLAAGRLGGAVVRGDDAASLTLHDAEEDGARELTRERCLGDPRVGDEPCASLVEIGGEDVLALGDAAMVASSSGERCFAPVVMISFTEKRGLVFT